MTDPTEDAPLPISNDRLKQTQFELASLEYEARGGGRDAYNRKSLLSLLIVVQHEIERVLVLSSIVACTANALEAGVANIKPRSLIRYFPRESSQLTLSGLRLNKWFADLDVRSLIDEFNDAQAEAKEETIAFTATGFSELRRDETGRSALALKWQKACAVGRKLLIGIDHQLANYEIKGVANEVSQLLKLLDEVASGRWPLIDENGDVGMPPWAEQRDFARIPVRTSAVLEHGRNEQKVILRDMSTTGLGLESVKGLKAGDHVVVRTGKGLELQGSVVWANSERAGISLHRPLHGDDPSLQFLTQRQDASSGTSRSETHSANGHTPALSPTK